MALLDAFKKKEEKKREPLKEDKVKPAEKEKEDKQVKAEKPVRGGSGLGKKEFSQAAAKVLRSPHVTEKAINLGQQNKYIFKVSPDANKVEVRIAIQELYGVGVENVNIINIPRRKKRLGAREGFKPGFKKAVITLRKGEKIETGV